MPDQVNSNIWDLLKQGDRSALVQLYQSLHKDLLLYGMKLCMDMDLVKDATNDVFIDIWQRRHSITGVSNTKAYLLTCLRHKIFRLRLQQQRHQEINILAREHEESEQVSHEAILLAAELNEEMRKKIARALTQLTPRQKELVYMRFYEGLDATQIEERTGMGRKTIYNTIYNALKVLGNILTEVSTS